MEPSLFSFIWKYSRREQLVLLGFTILTFPFLYATLELPKRIINDAIGAQHSVIDLFGVRITQVQLLMLLCFAYLAAVLVHGLLKMRLNTMKGVLAERLLRRFRFQLIARMMRFPRSYFENTSQGELVSMVTSEAEPMGGLMGDAVAQPAFQAGQMLIIVLFLFLQSPWFGLAGVALIPLQAWLIPLLQRQINLLNKERIKEVRHFAAEIGETAAGITDLRSNGGWRLRLAGFTDRLGRLFDIRFRIYQKKFFMKFLNNFITQLTPFFFYAVGGYLAIVGQITVGALVAALAAYKDLSSPWKELLTYYNQTQDMSLRWDVVTERFGPRNMIDERLFEGAPEEIPELKGDLVLSNVSLRNGDGDMVLEDLNLRIPAGAQVAIEVANQSERRALAEMLTRELLPSRGRIEIAGHDLSGLHQAVVAARIGYAHDKPYLFQGSVGENLLMPLRMRPRNSEGDMQASTALTLIGKGNGTAVEDRLRLEADRSGNSPDRVEPDWLDPGLAGLESREEVEEWWYKLSETLGLTETMFRNMLNARMDPEAHPELARQIVSLRGEVWEGLKKAGLAKAIHRLDPEKFNPGIPLGGNLIFATPLRDISQEGLAAERHFLGMIAEVGLAEEGIAISQTLVETLHQTFGRDGTDHPLFTALGIEEELYERLVDIAARRREKGDAALSEDEFALLLTVPFALTAEQIGPAFPESFKQEILHVRKTHGATLRERAKSMFIPVTPENYLPRFSLLENLIYGRVSAIAGLQGDLIVDLVAEILESHGLWRKIAVNVFDVPTNIGGTNLSSMFQERLAFNRAAIKRPDILVFNKPLSSHSNAALTQLRHRLGELLPRTTQIHLDDRFTDPDDFDLHVRISGGRIDGQEQLDRPTPEEDGSGDLRRKLRILSRNELFGNLDARNQRLLAFAAQWYEAEEGQRIFSINEPPDAAYLCLEGLAELTWRDPEGEGHHVADVRPGRLIGDLAVILDQPRQLDLTALEKTRFLRIGAEQLRAVIENDRGVLLSLLRTVAEHLTGAAELLRAARIDVPRQVDGPPAPPVDREPPR